MSRLFLELTTKVASSETENLVAGCFFKKKWPNSLLVALEQKKNKIKEKKSTWLPLERDPMSQKKKVKGRTRVGNSWAIKRRNDNYSILFTTNWQTQQLTNLSLFFLFF